jgi:hypothetical protein
LISFFLLTPARPKIPRPKRSIVAGSGTGAVPLFVIYACTVASLPKPIATPFSKSIEISFPAMVNVSGNEVESQFKIPPLTAATTVAQPPSPVPLLSMSGVSKPKVAVISKKPKPVPVAVMVKNSISHVSPSLSVLVRSPIS